MSQRPKTGRELVLESLYKEIRLATTGDLHRATSFLEGAREIRAGSKKQRMISRQNQKNAWKKKVDMPATW
tara:strand:+ start:4498 stop:4710 length:213 start_codon:yes stop_codon:yes gene_type:complete